MTPHSKTTPTVIPSAPAPRPPAIEFRDVTVTGNGDFTMLGDFNLTIQRGEVVALLGPSGAGKTTALRAVAGFVQPSSGSIFIDGEDVTHRPTRDRGLGMVVQSYALFPHMTVSQNVEFGLKCRKTPRRSRAGRVAEVLEMVGMSQFAQRHPRQLSGGQQQRVAIARALASSPDVLLLDEPLSALDTQLRQDMLAELARLHRELPDLTMLYVTHGQNEALTLADRIAVMANSGLVEVSSTQQLFSEPRHEFTARFLGGSNVINIRSTGPSTAEIPQVKGVNLDIAPSGLPEGAVGQVCVRPHRMRVLTEGETADNVLEMVIDDVQWRGSTYLLSGRVQGIELSVETLQSYNRPAVGETLRIGFSAEDAVVIREATS